MDKRTKFQKLIVSEFRDQGFKVTCRRDGTVEVRRSYFYPPQGGIIAWGDGIQKSLPAGKVVRVVDEFAQWPTTSYYCAVIREA